MAPNQILMLAVVGSVVSKGMDLRISVSLSRRYDRIEPERDKFGETERREIQPVTEAPSF